MNIRKKIARMMAFNQKPKAVVGDLIRYCSGGAHAWYESNVGPIRKPIQ